MTATGESAWGGGYANSRVLGQGHGPWSAATERKKRSKAWEALSKYEERAAIRAGLECAVVGLGG
jgi:hypothetical protein